MSERPVEYPPVLNTSEVAAMLDVSENTVRRLNLPAIEVGKGKWRYLRDQVLETLRKRTAA